MAVQRQLRRQQPHRGRQLEAVAAESGADIQPVDAVRPVDYRVRIRGLGIQSGVARGEFGVGHCRNAAGDSGPDFGDEALAGALGVDFRVVYVVLQIAVADQGKVGAFGSEINQVGDVAGAGVVGQLRRAAQVDDFVAGGAQGQVDAVGQ